MLRLKWIQVIKWGYRRLDIRSQISSGSTHLTHWGRATHKCVSKLTIIGSDNDLSPGRRQVIIWTNDGLLLIGRLGTNFSEILSKIHTFSFKKMHLKTSSAKWRLFCLGLNMSTLVSASDEHTRASPRVKIEYWSAIFNSKELCSLHD